MQNKTGSFISGVHIIILLFVACDVFATLLNS